MRTAILFSAMLVAFGAVFADEPPSRAIHPVSQKTLEEAPAKSAAEVMPMLVRNAGRTGRYPHEIRLGFNRQKVALTAIKKVADYEKWFRDRLRVLFPPGSVERDTLYGRIKMVAIPDDKRADNRTEQYIVFMTLKRLATDEAIRVLADYLWDDRFIYEPGSDYGSPSLAQDAAQALWAIAGTRKFGGTPGQFELNEWREWWTTKKELFAVPLKDRDRG